MPNRRLAWVVENTSASTLQAREIATRLNTDNQI
jgi:hypothetical protein